MRGLRSGRYALVLQFAPGSAPFEESLLPGSTIAATLAFWPGAFPQRALIEDRRAAVEPVVQRLPGFEDVAAFLESAAAAYARQPFLERLCCTIRGVMPFCEEKHFVRDQRLTKAELERLRAVLDRHIADEPHPASKAQRR